MATEGQKIGLPPRPFLYTVDQIATVLSVSVTTVKNTYLWYEERNIGVRPFAKLLAVNISPDGEKPEWRVAELELVRWLRFKGFKVYTRGFARS